MATARAQQTLLKGAARQILARGRPYTPRYPPGAHKLYVAKWDLGRDDDARGSFKREAALQYRLVDLLQRECDLTWIDVRMGEDQWLGTAYFYPNGAPLSGRKSDWTDLRLHAGVSYEITFVFYSSQKFHDARAGHNKTLK